MKKTLIALTFATSIFALSACSGSDDVVVSTKYGDITQEDFYDEMKSLVGNGVLEQVVITQALENNYDVSDKEVEEKFNSTKEQYGDQFDAFLSSNGIDEETYRKFVRLELLQQKALEDEVTDDEVKKYYEQGKYELHARHILFNTEDKDLAEEVLQKLKDGADFAELAKEYSQDGSADDGGDLGWFTVGSMVQEFNDAAYALEKNEISDLVKTDYGYHIIQLLDKREVENYPSFEEKEDEIRQNIANQKGWDEKAKELIKEADVDIKDDDLKNALDAYKD